MRRTAMREDSSPATANTPGRPDVAALKSGPRRGRPLARHRNPLVAADEISQVELVSCKALPRLAEGAAEDS